MGILLLQMMQLDGMNRKRSCRHSTLKIYDGHQRIKVAENGMRGVNRYMECEGFREVSGYAEGRGFQEVSRFVEGRKTEGSRGLKEGRGFRMIEEYVE